VAETSFGKSPCLFPYSETYDKDLNIIKRVFEPNVDSEELVWHRDKKDRIVNVVENNGWQLQYDNELPTELKVGFIYYLKKETYHRVLKGKGKLVVEIKEYE